MHVNYMFVCYDWLVAWIYILLCNPTTIIIMKSRYLESRRYSLNQLDSASEDLRGLETGDISRSKDAMTN